jgi:TolB protein
VNGRIAFTSFRDGALGDIWTVDPDGSDLRKLTADPPGAPPLYDAQSDWSPDGRSLAFRRGPNTSTRFGVWRMAADGSGRRLLAQGDPLVPRQNATQPSWAPDGASILFRANRPPYPDTDVWTMDPEGGGQRLLAHLEGEQLYPSYAPDMRRIAYASAPAGDRAIFTAAPDGSDVRVVFDAPGVDDSAPNWSPDGTRLAFESAIDGDGEIYVIGADGTGLQQLTDNDVHDEGPSWSPDGRRIVFTSGPDNLNGDVVVMNADGTERMQITASPGRDESPDWQPVPHEGDATACGDVAHDGAGPYSVKAGGSWPDCDRAHRLAARWAARAERGRPVRIVGGFVCRARDAGDGAQLVGCRHLSGRRTAVWLWRGTAA